MKFTDRIARFFLGSIAEDPMTLDHVAVPGGPDWREEKVRAAAARKNGAFKCGPDSVPREVLVDGKTLTLRPGEKPRATVTALSTRRKKT